jgi:hypothetical protein
MIALLIALLVSTQAFPGVLWGMPGPLRMQSMAGVESDPWNVGLNVFSGNGNRLGDHRDPFLISQPDIMLLSIFAKLLLLTFCVVI